MDLIINKKTFKQYKDTIYYVSKHGEVYSTYAKKIIKGLKRNVKGKTYLYIDVKNKETKKRQHINIHKMVYTAWIREPKKGEQVNHKDDNSLNNNLDNLYIGNQKENILDCINNEHRVGNVFYFTVLDKEKNKILTFCPAKNFIEYCGHPNKNGCLNKYFNKKWFKKRYEIIEFKRINNLNHYQNVTTMADECKPVE